MACVAVVFGKTSVVFGKTSVVFGKTSVVFGRYLVHSWTWQVLCRMKQLRCCGRKEL